MSSREFLECSSCGDRIFSNEQKIESSDLYNKLRVWRSKKKDEKGVTAFVVASNKTLRHICLNLPANEQDMLEIHGIGRKRFENFDFVEAFQIIKRCKNEKADLEVECDICRREVSSQATSSPMPPNNPQISSGGSHSSCPTCGRDWDGVLINPVSGIDRPLPHHDDWYIQHIENTDFSTDVQLDDSSTKKGVLDVEIRGITLQILSRIVDHYLAQSTVGRVFDKDNHSFFYTPEFVKGPLKTIGKFNRSGYFWRCKFSHTIRNGSCISCGDEVKNQSHHLCYPCWKKEN